MENFQPKMDPVPSVGEDTESILLEFGFDHSTIGNLRDSKAI